MELNGAELGPSTLYVLQPDNDIIRRTPSGFYSSAGGGSIHALRFFYDVPDLPRADSVLCLCFARCVSITVEHFDGFLFPCPR